MFVSYSNKADAYARVGVETGVTSASPHQLILMLYDGALASIQGAKVAMTDKNIPVKGQHISKAIDIILNGLKVSLNLDAGGELAVRLDALYDYMAERLLYANIHNNTAALEEVAALLDSLRSAWMSIADQAGAATMGDPSNE